MYSKTIVERIYQIYHNNTLAFRCLIESNIFNCIPLEIIRNPWMWTFDFKVPTYVIHSSKKIHDSSQTLDQLAIYINYYKHSTLYFFPDQEFGRGMAKSSTRQPDGFPFNFRHPLSTILEAIDSGSLLWCHRSNHECQTSTYTYIRV